jgi:hypothetical protein
MPTIERPAAYSVLLARPDFLANDTTDTYFTTVWGATVEAAVATARLEAATADELEECDLDDYAVLLVIAGDHEDLNPER